MYLYIYDAFVNKKKHLKTITNIEKRLTDLGINGKILKLKEIKNISHELQKKAETGLKNVVVVGNDSTVHKVINSIAIAKNINQGFTLGIIPLGEKNNNKMSSTLGVNDWEGACEILLARRTLKINIGQINNSYFLSEIKIENPDEYLEINKGYSVKLKQSGTIRIINFSYDIKTNPTNNFLDLYIFSKNKHLFSFTSSFETNKSYFEFKKLNTNNKKAKLLIDNCVKLAAPAHITLSSQKLSFIVGKNRDLTV